jgi:hypothetical protein
MNKTFQSTKDFFLKEQPLQPGRQYIMRRKNLMVAMALQGRIGTAVILLMYSKRFDHKITNERNHY